MADPTDDIAQQAAAAAAAASSASERIDIFNKGVLNLKESLGLAQSAFDKWANTGGLINRLSEALNGSTEKLQEFGETGLYVLGVFTGILQLNTKLFGDFGQIGEKAGFSIADSFGNIAPILEKLPFGYLTEGMMKAAKAADLIQNQQLGLYQTAAATGRLTEFLNGAGPELVNLGNVTARYTDQLLQSAIANHTTIAAMAQYTDNLRSIPGALNDTINAGERFGGVISVQAASVKIANGFMIDHKEVADVMAKTYQNFGTSASKSLDVFARIGVVMMNTKLPINIVKDSMLDFAASFKMFGDNSQAALNILDSFAPKLAASGLGPAGIKEIVQGMANGIQKMDVAHKAFISGASGGRGGLAGAFEIDEMMAKGEVDKVMTMVMTAMKRQFGGPVLERKDVIANQSLAGEFQKQIEFIKSVGGLAANDIEAQQILAAMKKGVGGELVKERQKSPQEAMNKAMELGNNIQMQIESNTGALVDSARKQETLQLAAAYKTKEGAQAFLGRERGSIAKAESEKAAKEAAAKTATASEDGYTSVGGFGRPSGRAVSINEGEFAKDTRKNIKEMQDQTSRLFERFLGSKAAAGIAGVSTTKPMVNELGKTVEIEKTPEEIRRATLSHIPVFLNKEGEAMAAGRTGATPSPNTALAPNQAATGTTAGTNGVTVGAPTEQVVRIEIDIKDGIEKVAHKTAKIAIENHQARGYSGK